MRIAIASVLVVAAAVPAGAAPAAAVIAAGYSYLPGGDGIAGGAVPGSTGPVVIARGSDVVFANLEPLAPDVHSMTSTGCLDPAKTCWFDTSDPTPQRVGEAVIVPTAALQPGVYPFYCTAHTVMRGTLLVV